jgi:hypothetical protein
MNNHLAIIPCTKGKIWDYFPRIGEVPAECAYIGPEFVLSKSLLSTCADRTVILSAKYGYLDLWDTIPETYDVTFSRLQDPYIDQESLNVQAQSKGLLNFRMITTTCNRYYQKRIIDTFAPSGLIITSPVKNLINEEKICRKIIEFISLKTKSHEYERIQ